MFFAIEEALAVLNNPYCDTFQMEQARIYLAQNATMDDIYGYGLDPMHVGWFQQNHHRHHFGMGGMGFGQQTIVEQSTDLFGDRRETIVERGLFGQETVIQENTDIFGNTTEVIETDNGFGGWF